MDNLSRDAAAALAAGMSYGDWKAQHPKTNPDHLQMVTGYEGEKLCRICGQPLPKGRSKYCSEECAKEATNMSRRKSY